MAAKKSSGASVSWASPDFTTTVKTNKNFTRNFNGAMLYAHYELTESELKKECLKYLKKLDAHHPLLERCRPIHENRFATVGKYMYILNHDADIPDSIMVGLMPALEKMINEEEAKIAKGEKENATIEKEGSSDKKLSEIIKLVPTIQDRLRDKAREVAGEVEGWIDDFYIDKARPIKSAEDFVNLFKTNNMKSAHMPHIRIAFEKRIKEFTLVAEGKDQYLVEAYSNLKKPEIKRMIVMLRNLFAACDMVQEVAKVERAPRKKKSISVEKVVSKLKFKKDDPTLGIVSVNPNQIPGAKDVWVYNTKTRKLAHYKAADDSGLSVKGASLLNFSTDSAEKTLRKPKETLAEFKKASKVKLRTFLKDIATIDIPAGGKLNEHHIILRIDK